MKYIAKEDISALLHELESRGGPVWAPQVIRDAVNTVLFAPWSGEEEIAMEGHTTLSPKELVMPPTEKIFSFRYESSGEGEDVIIDEAGCEVPERVLFGARACDARALSVLDALFVQPDGEAYGDPGYRSRRAALTVITIACVTCDAACFCSSFGEGPAENAGSDIFLYPVEEGYLAEQVTEKGAEIISGSSLFKESELEPPALASTARIATEDIGSRLRGIFSDLDFWREVTSTCLSCGYCSYSCPTCHCFNIFDEMRSDREGERLRGWDSCMFHLYTRETSGHNPRPEIAHRYRNRVNHKFSYYPENHGSFLCTGCGRCIRGCPANLDIRDVLAAAIERAAGEEATASESTDAAGAPGSAGQPESTREEALE